MQRLEGLLQFFGIQLEFKQFDCTQFRKDKPS